MIPADVRDAAKALVFAMESGAHGPDIQERTLRLMHALGDECAPEASRDAIRRILAHAGRTGAMPKDIAVALLHADGNALLQVVVHAGGNKTQASRLGAVSLRLYAVVLCLARVQEGLVLQ